MRDDLWETLRKKYPKIFPPEYKGGIACRDGWYNIINSTCIYIQLHVDETGCPQVEAIQVKEKFGTLRFYYRGGDSAIASIIQVMENHSAHTCEECGAPGMLRHDRKWVKTFCDEHAKTG